MENLFLVFVCDKLHTNSSKTLIAICDNVNAVECIISLNCDNNNVRKIKIQIKAFRYGKF